MSIDKCFNINDLIYVKIESDIKPKIDTIMSHWREFEVQSLDDEDIDIYIYDYSTHPNLVNPVVLSNYYYYSNNCLNIPSDKTCFNIIDFPFIIYCDSFIIPLNFLVELVLLKKGHTLIHSAAIQYNRKNYLFPAFGGIGKTTTVASVVYNGGKLFGDDMNIISEREILYYPMDFSVYPYHLDILKIKNKKLELKFKKTKIINEITNSLNKYEYKIIKLLILVLNSMKTIYVNISPKKIFGETSIVEKGQIDKICYLYRAENGLSEIIVERIDSDNLAEMCTNILLQEWHGSMSVLYTYSGLSAFSLDSIFDKIRDILRHIFMQNECYQIMIPNDLDNMTYNKQLILYLKNLK